MKQLSVQKEVGAATEIFKRLRKAHPGAAIELEFRGPFQLLVATILSAQCTDVKVNQVTPRLFARFSTPKKMAAAESSELEEIIRSTGFFRQKAKSIKGAAERIVKVFGGNVPETMEELRSLPGVGRKTANVVLGNAFGVPGLPVDTHVIRISNRLGLVKGDDAEKIESRLCQLIPPRYWTLFSHTLIFHGRRICKARNPLCEKCSVATYCLYLKQRSNR